MAIKNNLMKKKIIDNKSLLLSANYPHLTYLPIFLGKKFLNLKKKRRGHMINIGYNFFFKIFSVYFNTELKEKNDICSMPIAFNKNWWLKNNKTYTISQQFTFNSKFIKRRLYIYKNNKFSVLGFQAWHKVLINIYSLNFLKLLHKHDNFEKNLFFKRSFFKKNIYITNRLYNSNTLTVEKLKKFFFFNFLTTYHYSLQSNLIKVVNNIFFKENYFINFNILSLSDSNVVSYVKNNFISNNEIHSLKFEIKFLNYWNKLYVDKFSNNFIKLYLYNQFFDSLYFSILKTNNSIYCFEFNKEININFFSNVGNFLTLSYQNNNATKNGFFLLNLFFFLLRSIINNIKFRKSEYYGSNNANNFNKVVFDKLNNEIFSIIFVFKKYIKLYLFVILQNIFNQFNKVNSLKSFIFIGDEFSKLFTKGLLIFFFKRFNMFKIFSSYLIVNNRKNKNSYKNKNNLVLKNIVFSYISNMIKCCYKLDFSHFFSNSILYYNNFLVKIKKSNLNQLSDFFFTKTILSKYLERSNLYKNFFSITANSSLYVNSDTKDNNILREKNNFYYQTWRRKLFLLNRLKQKKLFSNGYNKSDSIKNRFNTNFLKLKKKRPIQNVFSFINDRKKNDLLFRKVYYKYNKFKYSKYQLKKNLFFFKMKNRLRLSFFKRKRIKHNFFKKKKKVNLVTSNFFKNLNLFNKDNFFLSYTKKNDRYKSYLNRLFNTNDFLNLFFKSFFYKKKLIDFLRKKEIYFSKYFKNFNNKKNYKVFLKNYISAKSDFYANKKGKDIIYDIYKNKNIEKNNFFTGSKRRRKYKRINKLNNNITFKNFFKKIKSIFLFKQFWKSSLNDNYLFYYKYLIKNTDFFFFKKLKLYNFFLKTKTNYSFSFNKREIYNDNSLSSEDKFFLLRSYFSFISNNHYIKNNKIINDYINKKDLFTLFIETFISNNKLYKNNFFITFFLFLKKNKMFIFDNKTVKYDNCLVHKYINVFLTKINFNFKSFLKNIFVKSKFDNKNIFKLYKLYRYFNNFFFILGKDTYGDNYNIKNNNYLISTKIKKYFNKYNFNKKKKKYFNKYNFNKKKKKYFNFNRTYKGKKKIGFECMTYYLNDSFNKRVFMVWYLNFFNLFVLYRKENKFWTNIKFFLRFLRSLKRFFIYYYLILFLLRELFFIKKINNSDVSLINKKNLFFHKFSKERLLLIFFKKIMMYINKSFLSLYSFIKFFFKVKINDYIEQNYYSFKFFKEKNFFYLNNFILNTYNNINNIGNIGSFGFQQKNVNLFDNIAIFNINNINRFKRKLLLYSDIYKNQVLSKNKKVLILENISYTFYVKLFYLTVNKILFNNKKYLNKLCKILSFKKKLFINNKKKNSLKFFFLFKKVKGFFSFNKDRKKNLFSFKRMKSLKEWNFILNQLQLVNYLNLSDYKNNFFIDLVTTNSIDINLNKKFLFFLFSPYINYVFILNRYVTLNNYIKFVNSFQELKNSIKLIISSRKKLFYLYKYTRYYKKIYLNLKKKKKNILFLEKNKKDLYKTNVINNADYNNTVFFFKYNLMLNDAFKQIKKKSYKNINLNRIITNHLSEKDNLHIVYILNNFLKKNACVRRKKINTFYKKSNKKIFNIDNFISSIIKSNYNFCFINNKLKKLEDLNFLLNSFLKNISFRKEYIKEKNSFNSYYNKFMILKDFDNNYFPTNNVTRSGLFYLKKYANKLLTDDLYHDLFYYKNNRNCVKYDYLYKMKSNFFQKKIFFLLLNKLYFCSGVSSKFYLPINWYDYIIYRYNKLYKDKSLNRNFSFVIRNIFKNKSSVLKFLKNKTSIFLTKNIYNSDIFNKNLSLKRVKVHHSKNINNFYLNKTKRYISINFKKSKIKSYLFPWRKDKNTVSFFKNDTIRAIKFYNYTFKRLFYNVGTCLINNYLLKSFKLNKLRTSLCLPKDEFIIFNNTNNYKNIFFKRFFIKKFWFNFFKYPLKIKNKKKYQNALKQRKNINKHLSRLSTDQRSFLKRRTLYNYYINNIIVLKKKNIKIQKKVKNLKFKKFKIKKFLFFKKLMKRNRKFFKKFLFHSRFYSAKNKFLNALRSKFNILYKNFKKILFNAMVILTKHSFSNFHKFFLLYYEDKNDYNYNDNSKLSYKPKFLSFIDDKSLNLLLKLRWILFFRLFCFYKIIISNIPKFFFIFDYSMFLNFDKNKIKSFIAEKKAKRLETFNLLERRILKKISIENNDIISMQ